MLYLVHFHPFFDHFINKLQVFNEGMFLIISYHQIMFTDFQPDIPTKIRASWSMIVIALIQLFMPNIFLVVTNIWPDLKRTVKKMCSKQSEKTKEA